METVPLQDPKDGWRANHGAFIRNGLMNFMTAFGICLQSRQLIPDLSVSMFRMVLVGLAHALTSAGFKTLVAEFWVFPTPYQYAWAAIPDATFIAIYFYIAIGRKQLREKPGLPGDLWRQIIVLAVAAGLCVIYPAYNAVFLQLNAWQQTLFVFVLPMMKFALQNVVAWSTQHIVEYMPGVVVFSVEVFNALYLAKCMQSQGSMATFVAIMAFDAFESIVAYRDMKIQTLELYELMKRYNKSNPDRGFIDTVIAVCQEPDVLSSKSSSIRIRSPIKLAVSSQTSILLDQLARTHSTNLGPVNSSEAPVPDTLDEGYELRSDSVSTQMSLHALTAVLPYPNDITSSQYATEAPRNSTDQNHSDSEMVPNGQSKSKSSSSVQPEPSGGLVGGSSFQISMAGTQSFKSAQASDSIRPSEQCTEELRIRHSIEFAVHNSELPQVAGNLGLSPEELARLASTSKSKDNKPEFRCQVLTMNEKATIVNQSLKLLFHCEYHTLVEYMEAMIPMLYCVYVAVLGYLPSHVYYIEMRHMTSAAIQRMVGNIFAYAWMEILSFIVMHFTIKWKFGFSPLYLLAFVLENQFLEFEARLLVWFSYVLQITLVHFGTLVLCLVGDGHYLTSISVCVTLNRR